MSLVVADFRSDDERSEASRDLEQQQRAVADALGAMLLGKFCEWRDARREKEEEWLRDLRSYNGIYEAGIAQKIAEGRSGVFVKITRTKVLSAYTRIVDLLFQSSDKHWSIAPTPVASGDFKQRAVASPELLAVSQQIGAPLPPQAVAAYAQKLAEDACKAMEREMEDQLEESGYELAVKQAIAEACILGSGAVKGVTVGVETETAWRPLSNGWAVVSADRAVPTIGGGSIFDLYPDPYATQLKDCEGIFQRHILTRSQFRDLAERFGFDEAAMTEVLTSHANGNYNQEHHEIERRKIAGYATDAGHSGRFEVLEYWGWVGGEQLEGCGCQVAERTADFQANVWTCGGRTVMARLNPHRPERLPYQIFPYERVPHQFWGNGVARQMEDSQETMNAAVRSLLDNLAISSGPMVEVNVDLLSEGEDPKDLHPWRVFQRDGGDPSYPLLRFYEVRNISQELLKVVEMFRRFSDEETSLPSYTHGESMPGLNKTASGMSMLMGAANLSVKGIIKNIDDYLVKPLIESLYHWNMRWSARPEIKGDMNVIARGSTALVAREVQSQRLIQFLQLTANPLDANFIDRTALLRDVAQALEIDPDKVIRDAQPEPPQAPPNAPGGFGGAVPVGQPGLGGFYGVPDPATGALPGPLRGQPGRGF